jgi:hypothetical protein
LQTRLSSVVLPAFALPITRMRKWVYVARSFAASSSVIVTVGAGLTEGAGSVVDTVDTRSAGDAGSTNGSIMSGDGCKGAGASSGKDEETSGGTVMTVGEGAATPGRSVVDTVEPETRSAGDVG